MGQKEKRKRETDLGRTPQERLTFALSSHSTSFALFAEGVELLRRSDGDIGSLLVLARVDGRRVNGAGLSSEERDQICTTTTATSRRKQEGEEEGKKRETHLVLNRPQALLANPDRKVRRQRSGNERRKKRKTPAVLVEVSGDDGLPSRSSTTEERLRGGSTAAGDLEDAGAVEGGDEVVLDLGDEEEGRLGEEVLAGEVVGSLQEEERGQSKKMRNEEKGGRTGYMPAPCNSHQAL